MIIFNFASRSRPEQFKDAVMSILKNISYENRFLILLKVDEDDINLKDYAEITYSSVITGKTYPILSKSIGNSRNKVHAINRDLSPFVLNNDIIINMSDDMRFVKKDFDLQLEEDFSNDFDQFIHYPDGHVNERLCTMSIIGGVYYRRFGYIYHPDYVSLWCDNEAQEVAHKLGKYKYVNTQLFDHQHPAWTGGVKDELLIKTEGFYMQDKRTYEKRKAAGFPNESILS